MPMPGFANYVREYSDPWAVYQSATPGDPEINVYLGPSKGNDITQGVQKTGRKDAAGIIVCGKMTEENKAMKRNIKLVINSNVMFYLIQMFNFCFIIFNYFLFISLLKSYLNLKK